MKFSYKFSNLFGTIYRNGNLVFSLDGYHVICPAGNRITIYDLKNNKSSTLNIESRYNYSNIALSPDGNLLIAVNDNGEAQLISLSTRSLMHRHKFQPGVKFVLFSPDGSYFAVAREKIVFIFQSPGGITCECNPFILQRHFLNGFDDVTWLDWSCDSHFLAIGCRDNTTKICSVNSLKKILTYNLNGHTDSIVACFFEANSLHINTLSRNGQLCLWECNLSLTEFTENDCNIDKSSLQQKRHKRGNGDANKDSEDDVGDIVGKQAEKDVLEESVISNEIKKKCIYYRKLWRHYLADEPRKENRRAVVTAAHYNKRTKILVAAFSTGSFYLYELPDLNMIHSLSVSDYPISAAVFNCTGDWVALASREVGQLLVWEWQSEQYIMKQQGHSNEMTCICYSPDGRYVASGGDDSKVKLWNMQSGFCVVTFQEHTSSVTDVKFSRNKKIVVSSSLDGTVRAFDVARYRNFRTFASPNPIQFACVDIDYSGELVVAGGQDIFDIYLWSIKTGNLLELISGHEGPVRTVAFSPVSTSSTLISGSWDKTVKIWGYLDKDSQHETIEILTDVTCVAFNPNGEQVAVASIAGSINVYDIKTTMLVSIIEGRKDLSAGCTDSDITTAKKNLEGKFFSTIEYSADGEYLLAAGKSQNICIYHVRDAMLLKKFEITQNHSLDGLNEFISRHQLTEFGNMALVEHREQLEGGKVFLRLPGVTKGDMASRNFKPEVNVFCVKFSPTGQAFAVSGSEGLCVYSLDKGVVFDPIDLSTEVTPKAIHDALKETEYYKALVMTLKLNETNLIALTLERIPFYDIELICSRLSNKFAHCLLQNISCFLQTTSHIEFYLHWCCCLLSSHGNIDGAYQHPALLSIHESVSRKYEMLNKICDYNKYTLSLLIDSAESRNKLKNTQTTCVESFKQNVQSDGENNILLMESRCNVDANDNDFACNLTSIGFDKQVTLGLITFSEDSKFFEWEHFKKFSVESACYSICFSPDTSLATIPKTITICGAHNDYMLRIFRTDLRRSHMLQVLSGHKNFINDISWVCNGEFLASISDDQTCKMWSVASNYESVITFCLKSPGMSVKCHPEDFNKVLVAEKRGIVHLYNVRTQQVIVSIESPTLPLISADWSASNRLYVTVLAAGDIITWDLSQPFIPADVKQVHENGGRIIRFAPNSSELVVASIGRPNITLKVFTAKSSVPLLEASLNLYGGLTWLQRLPFVAAAADRKLFFWKVQIN